MMGKNGANGRMAPNSPTGTAYFGHASVSVVNEILARWFMGKHSKVKRHDGITHGLSPSGQNGVAGWFVGRCGGRSEGDAYLLKDPCCYCGGRSDSIEHVIPVSLGGQSHYGNKVGACRLCNSRRSRQPFMPWLVKQHRDRGWNMARLTNRRNNI